MWRGPWHQNVLTIKHPRTTLGIEHSWCTGGQSSFELSRATQTHNRELGKSFLRGGVNSWVTAAHRASCPLCTPSATSAGEADGSPSLCKLRFWCTLVLLTAWFYTLESTGKPSSSSSPSTRPALQPPAHPTAEGNRDCRCCWTVPAGMRLHRLTTVTSKGWRAHTPWLTQVQLLLNSRDSGWPWFALRVSFPWMNSKPKHIVLLLGLPSSLCSRWKQRLDVMRRYLAWKIFICCNLLLRGCSWTRLDYTGLTREIFLWVSPARN